LRNSSRGSKLTRKRSAIVRRTSRKISFSPRKNVTTSNKKKTIKNQPFIEEQDILVEEELPTEDILDKEINANPTENPLVPEVQEYAGTNPNPIISKLKLFSFFLFFFSFLLLQFDEFFNPLSELFWLWGDEFYRTLILLITSLQLHLS